MSYSPPPPTAADLARHADGVRRLARRLVGNGDADDVAQDALARVMVRPPRRGYSLSAWLSGIVRNIVRERRRSEARRIHREKQVGHASVSESDQARAAGHVEQVGVLADALARLPEAYRAVVWWRYFTDRTPTEIGEMLGEPAATVRTRLRRALEKLRGDLRAEDAGDDGGWRVALAPLAGMAPAAKGAAVASATHWSAVGACLLLLISAGVGLFAWAPWDADEVTQTGGSAEVEVGQRDATLAGRTRTAEQAVPNVEQGRSLTVRVVAADTGAPIPAARLWIGQQLRGLGVVSLKDGPKEAETDDRGEARFKIRDPNPLSVRATAGAFLPVGATPVPGSAGTGHDLHVTVRMQRGEVLAGQVLLPDGQPPKTSATVRLWVYLRGTSGPARRRELTTEDAGRFQAVGLYPGAARLSVSCTDQGRRYVASTMAQTGDREVVLTLRAPVPGDQVRFQVRLQDEAGVPVEARGLRVVTRKMRGFSFHEYDPWVGSSREIGLVYDPATELFVEVFDLTSSRLAAALYGPVSINELGVTLTLRRGRSIEGIARGPAGEPVAAMRVAARCLYPFDKTIAIVGSIHATALTDKEGRFALHALAQADYRLEFVVPPGFVHPGERRVPAGVSEIAVDLASGAIATLTIIDDGDRPVEGARVHAYALREGARPGGTTHRDMLTSYETISAATTDAQGGVRLTGLQAGRRYTLVVQGPGEDTRRRIQQIDWEPADGTWRLGDAKRILGRVTYPDGTPANGSSIRWWRAGERTFHAKPVVDTRARFRIHGLARGPWEMCATSPGGAQSEPQTVQAGARDVLLVVPKAPARWVRVTEWRLGDAQATGLLILHSEGREPRRVQVRVPGDGRIDLVRHPDASAFSLWLGPLEGGRHVHIEKQGLPEQGEMRIDAEPGEALSGRVIAPPGVALEALTVEVGAPFRVAGARRPTDWIAARSDARTGTFQVLGLPAARTDVRARGYAAGVEYAAETQAVPGDAVVLTLERRQPARGR